MDREQAFRALSALAEARGSGCYLGMSKGQPVFGPPEHCALVLGPPRSGKTSGIVVPNVLAAGGVVAVSTKRDVLDETLHERAAVGRCLLYDPSGTVPVPAGVDRVGWSPLDASKTWSGAVAIAESMVGAARPSDGRGESAHWSERSAALLATLFHAATLDGAAMDDVVSWVNRREPERAERALSHADRELPLDLLDGIVQTDSREQSGIWSTASSVLAAYRTEAAIESSALPPACFEALLHGRDTLYVVASSEHQRHAAPLVAGLVRDLREHVYAQALAGQPSSSPPPATRTVATAPAPTTTARRPVLLVLDELANIAPLHDLPELVSEGGSQGLLTLACLQDLSQARTRWGTIADGFTSLFSSKIVLGGLGDARTLREIALLTGDHDVPSRSTSRSAFGTRVTKTDSTRRQPRLPPDAVAAMAFGRALVIRQGHVGRSDLPQLPPAREPRRSSTRQRVERRRQRQPVSRDQAFRSRGSLDGP